MCIGLYTHDESHIDLVRLTSFASVRFLHCEACGIDTENKMITCNDGRPPIRYDVLSIDIGITPKPLSNGMSQYSNITGVKPIDRFSVRWEVIMQRLLTVSPSTGTLTETQTAETVTPAQPLRVVVVGGGAGGCELCFAIHYRLCNELYKAGRNPELVEVMLATKNSQILSGHSR